MSAAYQQIEPEKSSFTSASGRLAALERHMRSQEALQMPHHAVEEHILEKTRDIARDVFQGHLELRGAAERPVRVVDADGLERGDRRRSTRRLRLLVGDVTVYRLIYQAPGAAGLCPQDAALALPDDCFSMGVRRCVAEEVCCGSFDHAVEQLARTTGTSVAKRQVEELTRAAAVDFDAFYVETESSPESDDQLLVLTFDGAGIIMRTDALRPDTRRKAEAAATQPKAWPERTKSGEKPNRKRMAEVAAVYGIAPHVRTVDDVIGELGSIRSARPADRPARPRPVNKRVWASVARDMNEVIDEGFLEARRRDPDGLRSWIVLVDGQDQQLDAIKAAAARHGVTITIVCDFIHTLEYIWKAAHCFYAAGTDEARQWVAEHARMLLEGVDPSMVAAGMRRSATRRKLETRAAVDKCAGYMIKRRAYLGYGIALAQGLPIATGVIEGACRHIVRDRLDCCGARWGVEGAEAVLKLRALKASGDFDDYWAFHLLREHQRNHASSYAGEVIPNPIPKPRLRLVK